jgi:hypothetical protein
VITVIITEYENSLGELAEDWLEWKDPGLASESSFAPDRARRGDLRRWATSGRIAQEAGETLANSGSLGHDDGGDAAAAVDGLVEYLRDKHATLVLAHHRRRPNEQTRQRSN